MTKQDYQDKLQEKLNSEISIDLKKSIIKAFDYFKAEPLLFFGFTALLLFLSIFTSRLQLFGALINVFLLPPLIAGYFTAARKMDNGEKISLLNFFEGFNHWLNVFVGTSLSGLLILSGSFLLLLPGIYLAISYIFVIPFMVLAGLEFWDAMEASRKLIAKNFWNAFAFVLGLLLLNLAGVMLFGIGVFISLPLTYLSIYAAFNNIFYEEKSFDASHIGSCFASGFRAVFPVYSRIIG
ncbi:MAG: glycerophosphoryl diester phosphodiesterase membrane domain-containing protein [Bacteroidales bacterium]